MGNPLARNVLSFNYEKSSVEIVEKAKKKRVEVAAKIEERHARIRRTREEYDIDDQAMIQLLQQVRAMDRHNRTSVSNYVTKNRTTGAIEERTIGIGHIEQIMSEEDAIVDDTDTVATLDLVIRNLRDLPDGKGNVVGHRLSQEALVFLGF